MGERRHEINPFEDGTALGALRGVPAFEEALSRLLYLAEHGRPCGIVRGPAGSGKSPLLECVIGELRCGGQECGEIDLRRTSADEFSWRLACELGTAPSRSDHRWCWRLIEDALRGRALAGRMTILTLDHLGEQGTDLLAELQRLLAIAEASAGWVTVLCAARSELRAVDHFVHAHSELRIELGPLDVDETGEFLRRVVETTGCCPFDEESVGALHAHSRGVLRDLMTLCRLAILARSGEETPHVTAEIVRLVAAEFTPSHPHQQNRADETARLAAVD